MKIKIDNRDIESLKKLNKAIEKLLNIYSESTEFTKDNMIKMKEALSEVRLELITVGPIHIRIVSSDGTEFTTLE